jgi:hypothetical protein
MCTDRAISPRAHSMVPSRLSSKPWPHLGQNTIAVYRRWRSGHTVCRLSAATLAAQFCFGDNPSGPAPRTAPSECQPLRSRARHEQKRHPGPHVVLREPNTRLPLHRAIPLRRGHSSVGQRLQSERARVASAQADRRDRLLRKTSLRSTERRHRRPRPLPCSSSNSCGRRRMCPAS